MEVYLEGFIMRIFGLVMMTLMLGWQSARAAKIDPIFETEIKNLWLANEMNAPLLRPEFTTKILSGLGDADRISLSSYWAPTVDVADEQKGAKKTKNKLWSSAFTFEALGENFVVNYSAQPLFIFSVIQRQPLKIKINHSKIYVIDEKNLRKSIQDVFVLSNIRPNIQPNIKSKKTNVSLWNLLRLISAAQAETLMTESESILTMYISGQQVRADSLSSSDVARVADLIRGDNKTNYSHYSSIKMGASVYENIMRSINIQTVRCKADNKAEGQVRYDGKTYDYRWDGDDLVISAHSPLENPAALHVRMNSMNPGDWRDYSKSNCEKFNFGTRDYEKAVAVYKKAFSDAGGFIETKAAACKSIFEGNPGKIKKCGAFKADVDAFEYCLQDMSGPLKRNFETYRGKCLQHTRLGDKMGPGCAQVYSDLKDNRMRVLEMQFCRQKEGEKCEFSSDQKKVLSNYFHYQVGDRDRGPTDEVKDKTTADWNKKILAIYSLNKICASSELRKQLPILDTKNSAPLEPASSSATH